LSLNSGGAVSGTPGAATHGSYSIKFKATNGWGILYGTGTVPLTIYRVMADRTTTSLTDAAVGQSYSYPLSASGGTPPYTWVVTGLPSGLSVVSGSITGTPAAGTNGTYTLSATATDSTSHGSQTQVYSLKVYPSDIRILTTSIPSATENHSYSATISTIGGTLPFTYLSSPLPSNLSFANSVLSGTPENGTSASSPYYVSVRVADANGSYAEQIFQLNITAS
ncbi:MAG: putative Ig domain-containing protein, partial [Candidatus Micrarchaeota archaeon]|nr:putative Ig domain-containing protein [Candidatus Micrarchaeota archaeon]